LDDLKLILVLDSASFGSNLRQANIYVGGLTSSSFEPRMFFFFCLISFFYLFSFVLEYVFHDDDILTAEVDMRPNKNTMHFIRKRVQIPAIVNNIPADPGVHLGVFSLCFYSFFYCELFFMYPVFFFFSFLFLLFEVFG
jgi:hypothetical protein